MPDTAEAEKDKSAASRSEQAPFVDLVLKLSAGFSRISKSYLAVKIDGAWKLRGARIVLSTVLDEIPAESDWEFETEHLRAGTEATAASAAMLRELCDEILTGPLELKIGSMSMAFAHDAQRNPGQYTYYRIGMPPIAGTRSAPGLRISFPENLQNIPHEAILNSELQNSNPPFRNVEDLLQAIDMSPGLLRGYILPHVDIIARAPGIVRDASLREGVAHAVFATASTLDRSGFEIKYVLNTDRRTKRGSISSSAIPWQPESDTSLIARIDFRDNIQGASISLSYLGIAFDCVALDVKKHTQNLDAKVNSGDSFATLFEHGHRAAMALDNVSIDRELTRLEATVDTDPEDAFRGAKDIIEACCKTILAERGISVAPSTSIQKLVRDTLKTIPLVPADLPSTAARDVKELLGALSTVATKIAEIRNRYGTGHGRSADFKGLTPKHARLAVRAAIAFVDFLAGD